MKIYLQNTSTGLIPMADADYDEKKRLKIGEVYEVSIKLARNYQFHKKYFALINCAWEYLNEKQTNFFGENVHTFRKTVEVAAGSYEPVFNIKKSEWQQMPKSIAFDKMKTEEFNDLYERAKDVLFNTFLKHITIKEFEENLKYF